ncbi:MAG TPA: purine-nucleoside phosphorylase [Ktedonobacteraceae bacterium]|nr:purine-nucleoside phosphorylase [Ktedonobacteraceae bacterium]
MLYDQAMEAVAAIRASSTHKPEVAIILGSGLGGLADELAGGVAIPYTEIPHFAHSTVVGHAGRLLIGSLEGVCTVVMQGRFHLYEGYTPQILTLPVRVMSLLGARTLIVSNAAGGVNPAYHPGDLMLIRDHIFLPGMAGVNPLAGANDERFGERFPPLAGAYDAGLRALARSAAARWPEIRLHEGVYTMVGGPNYETHAELRFLRAIGTDAVGMSTVPEVVVARHMGMRVLGVSLITNRATGEETLEVNHKDVLNIASAAGPGFSALIRGVLRAIQSGPGDATPSS